MLSDEVHLTHTANTLLSGSIGYNWISVDQCASGQHTPSFMYFVLVYSKACNGQKVIANETIASICKMSEARHNLIYVPTTYVTFVHIYFRYIQLTIDNKDQPCHTSFHLPFHLCRPEAACP